MKFLKSKWPVALAFAMIAFAPACTDLEEEVFTQLTPSTFPTNQDEVTAAVAFAYSQLYGFGNHGNFNSLSEVSSDEIMIPQRGSDWFDGGIWLRAHRHDFKPADGPVDGAWNFVFGGIAQTNATLSIMDNAEAAGVVDADVVATFSAEVRMIRALYYMWAIDGFGNVPIVTQDTEDSTPDTQDRSAVFDFIESEINAVIGDLSRDVAGTYGRMNYYVAQSMLAKLYLNAGIYTGTARWGDALNAANEVINSNEYALEGDYFANFNTNNEASGEIIFAIPFDENSGRGFNIAQMTLHYNSQETFQLQAQPWNGYCTLQEFYESYEDGDIRKGEFGNQQVRGNFHAGPQFAADGQTPILDSSFDDADEALVFTPEINEHFPGALRQAGARVGKYEYALGAMPDLSVDFPLFRYSDILLVKAECLMNGAGSGDAGEAEMLVDMVRDRANAGPIEGLTMDKLLAERGRELFYEGWRRNDLIRFGKFNDEWAFKTAATPDNPDVGTVRFDADVQLFPIPTNQLNANPDLRQNPGY